MFQHWGPVNTTNWPLAAHGSESCSFGLRDRESLLQCFPLQVILYLLLRRGDSALNLLVASYHSATHRKFLVTNYLKRQFGFPRPQSTSKTKVTKNGHCLRFAKVRGGFQCGMFLIAVLKGTTNNKNLIKIIVRHFVNLKHDIKMHNTNDSSQCARIQCARL